MNPKTKLSLLAILLSFWLSGDFLQAQTVYTFTPAGAAGVSGPTQAMTNTAYTGTSLDNQVTTIAGFQYWVVPTSGMYLIEGYGAQGYGSFGGRGAHISGEFTLTGGDTLKILAGQLAPPYLNFPATTYNHQFGGGGGSFVTTTSNTPLVVAGGGGGNHGTAYVASCDGQVATSGASGANGSTLGAGGTNGMGGSQASSADAGGGLLGNGAGTAGGQAFVNGALGGFDEGFGGFGCGGGTSSWNNYRGGGGGGYSGGGGANNGGTCCPAGGGGGSFNAGINPNDSAGINLGDGYVRITSLTRLPDDAGVDKIQGFAPPVCKGVYPVEVIVRNYGANQISPVTVEWSVNNVPQTPGTVNTVLDTAGGVGPDTALVVLGSVNITMATTIKAWTSMPNTVPDTSNVNDTLTITIAAPASANAVVDGNASCNGASDGSVSASGSGGTPGYTFLWSTADTSAAVSGLAAGTYVVTVTDSDGCTDTTSVTVGQPMPLVGVTTVSNISCNGEMDGQAIVNPTGGTPGYTIVWTPGGTTTIIDSLSPGTYAYTITDANGCVSTSSVTITEPPLLALSAVATDETAPGNGAIDLTVAGGTSGYTFLWSNGATTEDLSGITGGTYTVNVTDANGCMQTLSVTVVSLVAIDLQTVQGFEVFPNPSNGTFKVTFADPTLEVSIEVFDILGHRIRYIENAADVTEFKLVEGSGVYLVKLSNGTHSATKRVIVTD